MERPEEDAVDFLIAAREKPFTEKDVRKRARRFCRPIGTSRQETRPGARSLRRDRRP